MTSSSHNSRLFARLRVAAGLAVLATVSACSMLPTADTSDSGDETGSGGETLAEARDGFTTELVRDGNAYYELDQPPAGVFDVVSYPSDVGDLAAYLTPDPGDGAKHPAIVWITGGDSNTIGDVWSAADASNDQTAAAYRDAGVVMMFPSMRGGNMNPGKKEGFLGETDDIIAAAKYVAELPYVDPDRIFLGGHSTGGTLVLLVAELPNPFRAIFSFGPVSDPVAYGNPDWLLFDLDDAEEARVRNPSLWLDGVQTPTWVIEGDTEPTNADLVSEMADSTDNPDLHFYLAKGLDHFSVLAPINAELAPAVVADDGQGQFSVTLS